MAGSFRAEAADPSFLKRENVCDAQRTPFENRTIPNQIPIARIDILSGRNSSVCLGSKCFDRA